MTDNHSTIHAPLQPITSLLAGPGGTRVITASSIAYALFDWAGISLDRLGGVSGGAPAAALYASGMSGKEIVKLSLDLDFGQLVTFHLSAGDLITALKEAWSQWRAGRMPKTALISTRAIGDMVRDKTGGKWPKKFWTVAITHESRLVFTSDGVWEAPFVGAIRKISNQAIPIEIAIAATTSIPGIMHAVPVTIGQTDYVLYDGGLSTQPFSTENSHRDCPVDLAIALYGRHRLFVFDVGPDLTSIGRIIAGLRHRFVTTPPIPAAPDWLAQDALITLIDCPVGNVHTLKLGPSRDLKWTMIMKGFDATIAAMEKSSVISEEKLTQAKEIIKRRQEIEDDLRSEWEKISAIRNKTKREQKMKELDGAFATRVEALLSEYGII